MGTVSASPRTKRDSPRRPEPARALPSRREYTIGGVTPPGGSRELPASLRRCPIVTTARRSVRRGHEATFVLKPEARAFGLLAQRSPDARRDGISASPLSPCPWHGRTTPCTTRNARRRRRAPRSRRPAMSPSGGCTRFSSATGAEQPSSMASSVNAADCANVAASSSSLSL